MNPRCCSSGYLTSVCVLCMDDFDFDLDSALSDRNQLRNKNRPKIQEINFTDSPHMVP